MEGSITLPYHRSLIIPLRDIDWKDCIIFMFEFLEAPQNWFHKKQESTGGCE